MNEDTKLKLMNARITLDGRAARIIGRLNEFATIATIEAPLVSAEWSRSAAERIVNNGGQFRL